MRSAGIHSGAVGFVVRHDDRTAWPSNVLTCTKGLKPLLRTSVVRQTMPSVLSSCEAAYRSVRLCTPAVSLDDTHPSIWPMAYSGCLTGLLGGGALRGSGGLADLAPFDTAFGLLRMLDWAGGRRTDGGGRESAKRVNPPHESRNPRRGSGGKEM
jgi:hypothetical protein